MQGYIKRFGDYAVRLTDEAADDEYQADIAHRANSVIVATLVPVLLATGALLSWVLPGNLAWWSLVTFIPSFIFVAVGETWMRHYAPRPEASFPLPLMIVTMIPSVVMLAGLLYNVVGPGAGNNSLADLADSLNGGLIGMIIGAVIGGVIAIERSRRNRAKDTRLLEAELADDD